MSVASTEATVIEGMLPDLEAQGFETFLHPTPPLVPAFLGSYRPDLIALRDDKKVVFEVKHSSQAKSGKLQEISKLFEGHPDWEFRIVWISPSTTAQDVAEPDLASVRSRIAELRDLIAKGFEGPAMLLAWATLEAVGRRVLPEQLKRPQTPGRLVEVMASEGLVTPDEADLLRRLAEKRNRLIHGDLGTDIEAPDVIEFADMLESLLEQPRQ